MKRWDKGTLTINDVFAWAGFRFPDSVLNKGYDALVDHVKAYQSAAALDNATYEFIYKNREAIAAEILMRLTPLKEFHARIWDEYYCKRFDVKPEDRKGRVSVFLVGTTEYSGHRIGRLMSLTRLRSW